MSSSALCHLLSRHARFVLKENIYRNVHRFNGSAQSNNDDKKGKKEKDDSKHSESMDAFMKLEVQLRQKRKAREMLQNRQSDVDVEKKEYKVTTKPEEPGPMECCGLDCANCIWIEYAEKMVDYEEYVKAQKSS